MTQRTRCGPMRARAGTGPRVPNNSPVARAAFMGWRGLKRSLVTSRCGPWAEKNCARATIGFIVGGLHNATRPFRHDVSFDRCRQPAETILARRAEQAVAAMAAARR